MALMQPRVCEVQHAIMSSSSTLLGILGTREVHETAANTVALLVEDKLAGDDGAEDAEGIVQLLVVNGRVKTLDEDVAYTRSTDAQK
jgi:hypothetical protein